MLSSLFAGVTVAATFLALAPSAHGAVVFASEPHLLAFEHRQQVVLFIKTPAQGAMATRRPDGSFDIFVPDAQVGDELLGRIFSGPPVGPEGLGTAVSLAQTADGDVRINVRPAGNVARAVPRAVSGPPRLLIELLPASGKAAVPVQVASAKVERTGADLAPKTVARKAPTEERPQKVSTPAKPKRSAKARVEASSKPGAEPPPSQPTAKANAAPKQAPNEALPTAPKPEPKSTTKPATKPEPKSTTKTATKPATQVAAKGRPTSKAATAVASKTKSEPKPAAETAPVAARAAAVPIAFPATQSSGATALVCAEDDPRVAAAEANHGDLAAEPPAPDPLRGDSGAARAARGARWEHCQFMRVHGIAFCAPDSTQPEYRDDPYAAGVAHRISAGATWLAPIRMAERSPVAPMLAADREFVLHAETGFLLPAVRAYERAARITPDFPDMLRAHMNVALIYATLGFGPELVIQANDETNPARDFAEAVLGDLRRSEGRFAEAAALYESASRGSPFAVCFAARGLAGIALEEGRTDRARTGIAGLQDLCPREVLFDSETERLRAQVELALGDPDQALATLSSASLRASRPQQAEIVRERARIAETAGRLVEAREAWSELEAGGFGEEFALAGAIGLARLDASEKSIDDGLTRANGLPMAARERARRDLFVGVSDAALEDGDDFAALSMILAEGLRPTVLDVSAQVGLAAAYRRLGLLGEALATLDRVGEEPKTGLPESYWKERATLELARGDLAAADAALARWRGSRGGNPSAAELGLRVRVLSRRKAAPAEIEPLLARLDQMDASTALEARWAVAEDFAEIDPAAGLRFLGGKEALARRPDLSDERLAETLWPLGRAAERGGEEKVALAAYGALGEYLPATARGADASYRAGRLLEKEEEYGEARRAFERAATHPDALDRRFATATSGFHEIVQPWTRRQEEP